MSTASGNQQAPKRQQVEHSFTYHPPRGDQPERYTKLRDEAKKFAHLIMDLTPESREQSLALTNLEVTTQVPHATGKGVSAKTAAMAPSIERPCLRMVER